MSSGPILTRYGTSKVKTSEGQSLCPPLDSHTTTDRNFSVFEHILGCLLIGVYVPRIYRMPGGVIVVCLLGGVYVPRIYHIPGGVIVVCLLGGVYVPRIYRMHGGGVIVGCLFGGVYLPRSYRMPGGVIVGDSGLCCCVPVQRVTSIVRVQLLPIHIAC